MKTLEKKATYNHSIPKYKVYTKCNKAYFPVSLDYIMYLDSIRVTLWRKIWYLKVTAYTAMHLCKMKIFNDFWEIFTFTFQKINAIGQQYENKYGRLKLHI